jgi:hypothetical protein
MKIAHRFIGGIDDVIFDIKPALAGDRFSRPFHGLTFLHAYDPSPELSGLGYCHPSALADWDNTH